MKIFRCSVCQTPVYFENTACTACGTATGFAPGPLAMCAIDESGLARVSTDDGERVLERCANYEREQACNWLAARGEKFCLACQLNRTIPDLSVPGNQVLWERLETEKRRLVYSLLRLGLPITPRREGENGLAFDFLADPDPGFTERGRVLTGHDAGLITINIAEADPSERERMREEMDEPYRTILGHFRHESGHYYWDRLIEGTRWLAPFRELFGDERADYGEALARNYAAGPPADWHDHYVSSYATSHPWEDWAETWSHYLHMVETLETAWQFGFRTSPRAPNTKMLQSEPSADPYREEDFEALVSDWLPFTVALNALNRAMGQDLAYPFVLPSPVLEKLAFVHALVRETSDRSAPHPGPAR